MLKKDKLSFYLKSIMSWKTKRKIVVFAVDDYGNNRIASSVAKDNLIKAGVKLENNFDNYDSPETADDLNALYDVLSSVRDCTERYAVFTAFANVVNIDFDAMKKTGFQKYIYIKFNDFFSSLPMHDGVVNLWKEGIKARVIYPEYHGREHINISILMENLKNKDPLTLTCFDNKSYCGIKSKKKHYISYVQPFAYEDISEIDELKKNASDGVAIFEETFGFKPSAFTPPALASHKIIEKHLKDYGIKYLDKLFIYSYHLGNGKFKRDINYTGKINEVGQKVIVRNCSFEPFPNSGINWSAKTYSQLEMAFSNNVPAIISSHRLNFAGGINEKIRKNGLNELSRLLKLITKKYPQVEFLTYKELGELL